MKFVKPNLVLSSCLDLKPVRYNGEVVRDDFVVKLREYCNIVPVCPEIAIGLGVPRDRVIIYRKQDGFGVSQPTTKRDLTDKMNEFSKNFLSSIRNIDGFLLKSKSPSCGISNTVIYKDFEGTIKQGKGKGLFAMNVLEAFPDLPVEDEGRLKNPELKDIFLTRLFAFARWRVFKQNVENIAQLREFHQNQKYLFMSLSQTNLQKMGRLLANFKASKDFDNLKQEYEILYKQALNKKPTSGKNINVLMHIFGYFSEELKPNEKKHFLELLQKFKAGNISLNSVRELIKSWAFRFENSYILSQTYLEPYPEELGY